MIYTRSDYQKFWSFTYMSKQKIDIVQPSSISPGLLAPCRAFGSPFLGLRKGNSAGTVKPCLFIELAIIRESRIVTGYIEDKAQKMMDQKAVKINLPAIKAARLQSTINLAFGRKQQKDCLVAQYRIDEGYLELGTKFDKCKF